MTSSCYRCRQRLNARKSSRLYTAYLFIGTAFYLVSVVTAIPAISSEALKEHLTSIGPPDGGNIVTTTTTASPTTVDGLTQPPKPETGLD